MRSFPMQAGLLTILAAGAAAGVVTSALAACSSAAPAMIAPPQVDAPTSVIQIATTMPLPAVSPTAVTALPASDAATPSPETSNGSQIGDVYAGLRITDLAAREYGGPGIIVGDIVKSGQGFTQYRMMYESDGLTITGLIDVPDGKGPFPTIIVNHGYLRPIDYQPGFDSWRIADWLAQRGYIALMPDYRNYAGSDSGPNPFHIGFAIDVMNLAAQISSLPVAAPGQIGIVGHSMGGEIAMWPMVISGEVDAVVLYASMSGDVGRNWAHARRYWPTQRDTMDALEMIYGTAEEHPQSFAEMSPINYLDWVRMPVMIHHGTRDESIPYWWSEELWSLLQDAGADVTFWPYPGGGHALGGRGFETFMRRNIAFFDQHVRGDVNSPVGE